MIDLTPLDVRKKRDDFKRTVRGYDPSQVDAFLEVVSDRLEQLVREHGTLSDQVAHMQRQLETYQERERALNEALLAAQELREEARSQAERDAAVRLREAETHAEAILLDADQAIRHSGRRLDDLRARRRQFLKSLRSVMDRFEDYLELEETRLETEPEDLGDLLERLDNDLAPVEAKLAAGSKGEAGSTDVEGSEADSSVEAEAVAESSDEEMEEPDAEPDPKPIVVEVDDEGPAGADTVATADDAGAEDAEAAVAAPSKNGHAEDAEIVEPVQEAESGSRIAAPQPITPGDTGEPKPAAS